MLSGETAAGAYPVESLETMVRIADRTEQDIDYRKRFFARDRKANPDITDAICHATCMQCNMRYDRRKSSAPAEYGLGCDSSDFRE